MKLLVILLFLATTSCGPQLFTNPLFTPPSTVTPEGAATDPLPPSAHPVAVSTGYSAWQVWLFIAGGIGIVCVASSYSSIISAVKSRRRRGESPPENVSLGALQGKK